MSSKAARKREEAEPLSEHYYRDLCDVEFLSGLTYEARIGTLRVIVAAPGLPIWASVHDARGLAGEPGERVRDLYLHSLKRDGSLRFARPEELAMGRVLALESAYRLGNISLIRDIASEIGSTGPASDRAAKILRALQARILLEPFQSETVAASLASPGQRLRAQPLEFLANERPDFVAAGWSREDVVVERPVRKDFDARGIDLEDRQRVLDFYRDTPSYIFELTAANYQVETLSNYMRTLNVLRNDGIGTVLDYGAGIGTFVLLCARIGIDCTYAELESQTFRYGAWRASLHAGSAARVSFVEIQDDGHVPPGQWDAVICTEVLEHVFEPETLLDGLIERVRPGGLLVVSESYDYVDEFCTHLPRHRGKGGLRFIDGLLRRGLEPVLVKGDCHIQVWRKTS
jgi:SAM-dependent methyltransferase